VEILLLGTGLFDSWCLEVMAGAGGCAVVADWQTSGAFPRQVFLSIEEDIPGGIGRALALAPGSAAPVSGPVRIVSGAARPIPAEVRSRVEEK